MRVQAHPPAVAWLTWPKQCNNSSSRYVAKILRIAASWLGLILGSSGTRASTLCLEFSAAVWKTASELGAVVA